MSNKRLLVVQVAALGYDFLRSVAAEELFESAPAQPLEPVFPALTCPVQATLRTATFPAEHGMVMNGSYNRSLRKPLFWEQSSALVEGGRIWKEHGGTTGMFFWQQLLGEKVDLLLSPAPIHTHGGGMVDAVYSKTPDLYQKLAEKVGRKFRLSNYWGPLASSKSSKWIAEATAETMKDPALAPDLLFTYIPHLDYALQKYGPDSRQAKTAFNETAVLLKSLIATAEPAGYDFIIFGDYPILPVSRAVFPNRLLRDAQLFKTREIGRRLYPDFHYSDAFAVVDHEIAHVYTSGPEATEKAKVLFEAAEGVEAVYDKAAQQTLKINHERSGDLVLTSSEGAWFGYSWWSEKSQAPDYATHVDIHNKPGYDPCELFFGAHPFVVSTDTSKIKGSHGKTGPGRAAALISNLDTSGVHTQVELAEFIKAFHG